MCEMLDVGDGRGVEIDGVTGLVCVGAGVNVGVVVGVGRDVGMGGRVADVVVNDLP